MFSGSDAEGTHRQRELKSYVDRESSGQSERVKKI